MEGKSFARHGLGILFLSLAVASPIEAVTQGKPGKTSSASFTITMTIHPSLRSQVAIVDTGIVDKAGNPTVIPTDTLSFNTPVSLCVAGLGLSQYSLTAAGNEDINLQAIDPTGTTRITNDPSQPFATQTNCQNSTLSISATPTASFQGTTRPTTLIIHAN